MKIGSRRENQNKGLRKLKSSKRKKINNLRNIYKAELGKNYNLFTKRKKKDYKECKTNCMSKPKLQF